MNWLHCRQQSKIVDFFSYAENMKIRSKRFRDQPEKPIDRAVWWTEYLLRHPNPVHLQSPVPKLGFLRSNLFDIVFAVGFICCLMFTLIAYIALKYLWCRTMEKKKIE